MSNAKLENDSQKGKATEPDRNRHPLKYLCKLTSLLGSGFRSEIE